MNIYGEEQSDESIPGPPTIPGRRPRFVRDDGGADSSADALAQIDQAIRFAGLFPRGALRLEDAERIAGLENVATIVLIGVVGEQGWRAFARSPERRDGAPHPLDRWSRRVIDALAAACGGRALYPFGGPPYWPFQQWATRAEPVHPSPLGMLIHPEYGLWHSYRGALAFAEALTVRPPTPARPSPCETCAAKPCLSACPVGAFSKRGYDVAGCTAHLRSEAGRACMEGGCLARRACPVGAEYAQAAEQAEFHLKAFLAAR